MSVAYNFCGVIRDAVERNVNGAGTERELVLEVDYTANDDSGSFSCWRQFNVPLRHKQPIEASKLIGRTIHISIS